MPQPVQEQATACAELLKAGKIRAVGVCNFSVEQLEAWRETKLPLHTLQTPYSILRPASGADVLPWSHAHELGTLAYSPLLRGMLFGTWTADKTFPAEDGRAEHKDYSGPRFVRHLKAVEELKALAAKNGTTCPNLAIGVLLNNPMLTAVIVGARNARQGKFITTLGQPISNEVDGEVWKIIGRLNQDLVGM